MALIPRIFLWFGASGTGKSSLVLPKSSNVTFFQRSSDFTRVLYVDSSGIYADLCVLHWWVMAQPLQSRRLRSSTAPLSTQQVLHQQLAELEHDLRKLSAGGEVGTVTPGVATGGRRWPAHDAAGVEPARGLGTERWMAMVGGRCLGWMDGCYGRKHTQPPTGLNGLVCFMIFRFANQLVFFGLLPFVKCIKCTMYMSRIIVQSHTHTL